MKEQWKQKKKPNRCNHYKRDSNTSPSPFTNICYHFHNNYNDEEDDDNSNADKNNMLLFFIFHSLQSSTIASSFHSEAKTKCDVIGSKFFFFFLNHSKLRACYCWL